MKTKLNPPSPIDGTMGAISKEDMNGRIYN